MKEKLKVKVKKKVRDEEGGENHRMTRYKRIGKKNENDWEEVVKEIVLAIYTKKKRKKVKNYLPSLIDDLLRNLCLFYLV